MPACLRTTLRFPRLSGPEMVTDRSFTWKRRTEPPKTSRTRPSKATMRFGPAPTSSKLMTAKVPGTKRVPRERAPFRVEGAQIALTGCRELVGERYVLR